MDKSDIGLSSGIVGEWPSKPPRDLMKNGQWVVPPSERPKGWELIGLPPAPLPPLSVPAPIDLPAPELSIAQTVEEENKEEAIQQKDQQGNVMEISRELIISKLAISQVNEEIRFEISDREKKDLSHRIRNATMQSRLRRMRFSVCMGDACVIVIKTEDRNKAEVESPIRASSQVTTTSSAVVGAPPAFAPLEELKVLAPYASEATSEIKSLEQHLIEQTFQLCRDDEQDSTLVRGIRESAAQLKIRRRALELANELVDGWVEHIQFDRSDVKSLQELWKRAYAAFTNTLTASSK